MSDIYWIQVMAIAFVWIANIIYIIVAVPLDNNATQRKMLVYRGRVVMFVIGTFAFTTINVLYIVHKAWIVN